ncbi:MAG: DUF4062 domain-containing protein, partial [Planctomycetota bacterium]|nr:DUF4062 domain-containing protein [Planctomycetota bacterium]
MARPRVFISSTFYDLKQVRADVERFISSLGYEAIRHEAGAIPYAKQAPIEEATYREVGLCDIIVCIVGGRYGTGSATREGSITQNELRRALERGVQVYVFIENSVYAEYRTYELNKDGTNTRYACVDNPAIFRFLDEVLSLP